jgi:hypothetical protein
LAKAAIAYIVILIILVVVTYLFTGFRFLLPGHGITKTTITGSSSTISNAGNSTVTASTTINASNTESPCSSFQIVSQKFNSSTISKCLSTGGTYGVWVAAGNSGSESVRIIGADGRTYVNQTSSYNCTTFFQNFTGPAQLYTVTFTTGPGNGSCGNSEVLINTTTTPPQNVYNYIYNGNFGNGQYTGWNKTNPGFGNAPLNITRSNNPNVSCYYGTPWKNYNGTYFATTYNCGTSVSIGNLTSSTFSVNPGTPFLNFRIISPQDNQLYVELLRQTYSDGEFVLTPVTIAHINTYNSSTSLNASSTFANVSIPLTSYVNQNLKVRLVAGAFNNFIAAGDFALAKRPNQQIGVAINITVLSS